MSLLAVLLGTALLAGLTFQVRRRFGNKKTEIERRKPRLDAAPALQERRKDDEVGGEA